MDEQLMVVRHEPVEFVGIVVNNFHLHFAPPAILGWSYNISGGKQYSYFTNYVMFSFTPKRQRVKASA
jgi:hypothetical protein